MILGMYQSLHEEMPVNKSNRHDNGEKNEERWNLGSSFQANHGIQREISTWRKNNLVHTAREVHLAIDSTDSLPEA